MRQLILAAAAGSAALLAGFGTANAQVVIQTPPGGVNFGATYYYDDDYVPGPRVYGYSYYAPNYYGPRAYGYYAAPGPRVYGYSYYAPNYYGPRAYGYYAAPGPRVYGYTYYAPNYYRPRVYGYYGEAAGPRVYGYYYSPYSRYVYGYRAPQSYTDRVQCGRLAYWDGQLCITGFRR